MAKRIVICFDGTWNTPDEHFAGLDAAGTPANGQGKVSDSFAAFMDGTFRLFAKRYWRPVGKQVYGQELVDKTVTDRLRSDITYHPQNDGLARALAAATNPQPATTG